MYKKVDGNFFTRELLSLLMRSGAVRELCRVHDRLELADQVRARACTSDDIDRIHKHEMVLLLPKLGVPAHFPTDCKVPVDCDVASQPLGCFGVCIHREVFYKNMREGSHVGRQEHLVNVMTSAGEYTMAFNFIAAHEWNSTTRHPGVKIRASTRFLAGDIPQSNSAPVLVLKLCKVSMTIEGDPDTCELQQRIRRTFFDGMEHSHTSKVLSYESAPDGVDPFAVEDEDVIVHGPWSGYGHSANLRYRLTDINRGDEAEKQRAKLDKTDAASMGADRLGGEDGWGFVSFVFTVTESQAMHRLLEEDGDDDRRDVCADDVLILEIGG